MKSLTVNRIMSFCNTGSKTSSHSLLRSLALFVLLAGLSLFLGYGLSNLEFFRHTEADRSLIAWEMLESGDYIVPHLLGSAILTKPPIYYWLQVVSFEIFGEVSTATARFPSLFAGVFACCMLFFLMRRLGYSFIESVFSSFLLASSSQFFLLARSAEIDMWYGLLSWIALLLLFVGEYQRRATLLALSYFVLGLAFVTKGPPIVAFFGFSVLVLRTLILRRSLFSFAWIGIQVVGVACFAVPVGIWLLALSSEVGWLALYNEFQTEIIGRALEPSTRGRGLFFYPMGVISMALPWSAFAILGLVGLLHQKVALKNLFSQSSSVQIAFLKYSLAVVVVAISLLMVAQGKSYRYLFPVYFFFLFLFCVFLLNFLRCWTVPKISQTVAQRIGFVVIAGLSVGLTFFLWRDTAVFNAGGVVLFFAELILGIVYLLFAFSKGSARNLIIAVVLLVFSIRLGYQNLYIPSRNNSRSVLPVVDAIEKHLGEGVELYTIEMYERWVVFYLKSHGRKTFRVYPELADSLAKQGGKILLLLNQEEESWRVMELRRFDPETKIIARFENTRDPLLLVSTSAQALPQLELQERFPTTKTKTELSKSFALGDLKL